MADICEGIIIDYLEGQLSRKELEDSLTSIFQASNNSSTQTQLMLQSLYSNKSINDEQFRMLSELVSRITIHLTISHNQPTTDISYFNEDRTLNLTDVTEVLQEDSTTDRADKTIIIHTDSAKPITDVSLEITADNELNSDDFRKDELPVSSESNKPSAATPQNKPTRHENLGTGATLKNRFVLIERLGQGGMGVVFRAKDLLKVEAKDKDPFVAIKVLTDAFKKYSGSFIALQREASKAQRLAHPNIATVYDFDRDGDTVFMTMEYLKGQPLNKLIKELAEKPLKKEQALNIIEQLCDGLAYAHEKNLIHSDFKPGNCFLLSDGSVKLLDFGIARASTSPGEEKEQTMFDPSKLSAVTPAYATPEMFAGLSPDPRDDIYGLACVSYQLLAGGRHPYNKVASPKIKELGIKPKPIKGLDRRQQRTLMKALSINREDRTPSVEKFKAGLEIKKSYTREIIFGALFLSIIGAGIGYQPFIQFREEQSLFDQINEIKAGNKAMLIETIWGLEKYDEQQKKILSVGLRREIITFYRDRVKSVFRPENGLYDYPRAVSLLQQAKLLYPDSVALSTVDEQIKDQKDRLMSQLIALYNRYVDQKRLIKTESGEDMTTVLPLLKKIDPKHYLLKDNNLAELYLSEAERYLVKKDYKTATEFLNTGLSYFPDNPRLQSLDQQFNISNSAK